MGSFPKIDAGVAAAFSFLALLGIAISCSDAPSRVTGRDDARLTRSLTLINATKATPGDVQRANAAKKAMTWVGAAHHQGMSVVIASAQAAKLAGKARPRPGSAAYCRLLEQVGEVTLRDIDRAQQAVRPADERTAHVRSLPELATCLPVLSAFGTASASRGVFTRQESEPEITGAYEPYVVPMEDAVNYSNGSVASVQAATDQVLVAASAAGLPEGDLQALAAMAVLAVSSASEWNGFDFTTVGGNDACTDISCNQMSLFPRTEIDGRVLKLVGADAGGCFAAVKSWGALRILLATPAAKALAGYCGVRAAIASGAAFMAMF